jgi:hypothetical protein
MEEKKNGKLNVSFELDEEQVKLLEEVSPIFMTTQGAQQKLETNQAAKFIFIQFLLNQDRVAKEKLLMR